MRTATLTNDPKLVRIAEALRDAFGARLASALLFGSRARGDHRLDSDYDVAVFLDGYERDADSMVLGRIRDRLGEDVFTLQFWPFGKDGLAERTTLMFNIRNEGVPLPGLDWPAVIAPPIAPDEGPMKPESKDLLETAVSGLSLAQSMLRDGYAKPAAREAYQSVLRAARAFIFEQSDKAPKTHKGTVALFSDLAVKTGLIDEDIGAALSRGLGVRLDVDYAAVPKTSDQQAAEYVQQAANFMGAINSLLEAKR